MSEFYGKFDKDLRHAEEHMTDIKRMEKPTDLKCEKCGGTVFRQFATPTEPDEAAIAQLEEQARSIALDDASPETTADDVRDLDTR